MNGDKDFLQDFVKDIPRGLTSKYIKHQTAPQARWMDVEKAMASSLLDYDPRNPGDKILLGAIGDKLVGVSDNRHVQTIAGSRAGKSVTLIGNLFFYQGSTLNIDPKGELAEITAGARAAMGQDVYVLDPYKRVQGAAAEFRAGYNPLTILKLDNPFIIEDAVQIVDAMVIKTAGQKDPHWDESAADLIMGCCLFVAIAPGVANKDRHLGTVRALINDMLMPGAGGESYKVLDTVEPAVTDLMAGGHEVAASAIESAFVGFYEKPDNERAGVLSTARRHTKFLEYAGMKDVLSRHSFDLADLKRNPKGVSIYLCLPATKMGMCNRWLRLIINQMLDAMERERTKPKAPVLVMLDEFPVLGHMQSLQDAAGQVASFGVKLWFVLQDWGQGKALYGERFESFAANAGVLQCFGNVDLTTTEYLSRRLGNTIIESVQSSEVSQDQIERGVTGRSEALQSFPLLSPDEVRRLFARDDPHKRQLILWGGYHPMVLQRVEYFDNAGVLRKHIKLTFKRKEGQCLI